MLWRALMLELHNVTVTSRGITRLNFSVAAGEIVALIGRNGAGKTTLLRLPPGPRPQAGDGSRMRWRRSAGPRES